MSFADDLAAVSAAEPVYVDVDVTVNNNLHVLRFVALDPFEWASEVDNHPARLGVQIDLRYGYNLRSIVRAVAPLTGSLVEGGGTVTVEDWPALLKAIGGAGFQRVSDAVWNLNEYLPELAVVQAKKALSVSKKSSA